ncbi:MAG: GNAT family acetyltransferase [Endozoicomonas sp.]
MIIRTFIGQDEEQVIRLWNHCGLTVPWNDPASDIRRKMEIGSELFLVGEDEGRIVASVMGGYEGHRGWVNYLAVEPGRQGRGLGRQLMQHLERLLLEKGCPKINLQVRTSNKNVARFYKALGYQVDEVVSLGKRLPTNTV